MALSNSVTLALRVIELVGLLLPVSAILLQITVSYSLDAEVDISERNRRAIWLFGIFSVLFFAAAAIVSGAYIALQPFDGVVIRSVYVVLVGIVLLSFMGLFLFRSIERATRGAKAPDAVGEHTGGREP